MSKAYCLNPYSYKRIPTREVNIGGVPLGGNNPIRIQSMTTTDTMDTEGTIQQSLRMVASGAEYVRITAPSKKEAFNLEEIQKGLRAAGCNVPLVADIHYTPNAAEVAARIVAKVRVNPGNYIDKKKFNIIEYSDQQYEAEIERIYKRFSPLVKICKEHGTAMRIGTNHGSLSDRILSRYGDTPLGMVESAMEFMRICEDHDYHDLVISMKASNPQVMVQAYRLLMQRSLERGLVYPVHLGVTEAGEGEDGRIKSAVGISTLLMDGIGDTVRVSLTEEPEYESPVARFIVNHFEKLPTPPVDSYSKESEALVDPYSFRRRKTAEFGKIGGEQVPVVVSGKAAAQSELEFFKAAGYSYLPVLDKYGISDLAADFFYWQEGLDEKAEIPGGASNIIPASSINNNHKNTPIVYFEDIEGYANRENKEEAYSLLRINSVEELEGLAGDEKVAIVLEADDQWSPWKWRGIIAELLKRNWSYPVVFKIQSPEDYPFYEDTHIDPLWRLSRESKEQLYLSSLLGTFIVDGTIDGVWVDEADRNGCITAFGALQAGRLRITKTEYISCPSCGRTLFDLQETTARIRKRTEHLKGVKIGIMGCIVNGPGEMADADFGYVGVGPGKIALYKGQEVVKKAVKTEEAVDQLIDLIKEHGRWIEPVA